MSVVVIGAGPAGLKACKSLLDAGVEVILIERDSLLGGQLVKQTHKFFGSKEQYAKMRGFDIAKQLVNDIKDHPLLTLKLNSNVVALFDQDDSILVSVYKESHYEEIKATRVILATGASEKFLAFENNDVPQIMGAGAIQTLMNVHGVMPAKEVVMIGSGNIGLIVSYQLIQAGIKVKCIIEASDTIGGYSVHASKLKRLGVPFYMKSTIKKVIGTECVEAVEIVSLEDQSVTTLMCDALCIAVGLSPSYQLAAMLGVKTQYIKELGGDVVLLNDRYQSSHSHCYVVGDASGIEEASAAMMEGVLAGLYCALSLDKKVDESLIEETLKQLNDLRNGPYGQKFLKGQRQMKGVQNVI